RTHFRRHLADLLAVYAADRELRVLGIDSDGDTSGNAHFDRVRVTEVEHHGFLTLHFRLVTDAYDLQVTRPAVRHADHGIVQQCARQSVNSGLRVILA